MTGYEAPPQGVDSPALALPRPRGARLGDTPSLGDGTVRPRRGPRPKEPGRWPSPARSPAQPRAPGGGDRRPPRAQRPRPRGRRTHGRSAGQRPGPLTWAVLPHRARRSAQARARSAVPRAAAAPAPQHPPRPQGRHLGGCLPSSIKCGWFSCQLVHEFLPISIPRILGHVQASLPFSWTLGYARPP